MNKPKILITGSGGFIGGNIIRKLMFYKPNYEVCSIDLCKNPNVLNNVYNNKNHNFYIGNCADAHFVNTVFDIEKPNIVLHLAAESFVDASIADANPFIHSNVLGTQVMLDAALKWKVDKFIHMSTDEVLGQLTDESQSSWTEEAPLKPRNPYSASKAAAEFLVQAAHQTHGLNYVILRSCNNFGPRQHYRNFIPKTIRSILNNEPVTIFGEGKQVREWIFVEDTYHALMTILEKGKLNEIYNISTGFEFSNLEVFQKICNVMGTGHNSANFVEDRKGHDYRYSLDSTKLRKLGWTPTWKFQKGLEQTIVWYVNNKWFFGK